MMMSRWRSVVLRILLLLLLLLVLLTVSIEAVESDTDKAPRTKRQTSSTCEAKYREFSAQHTLCLEDNPDATLVPLSQEKKDEIVQIHNNIRASVDPPAANMMMMRWDERMARTAEKWVMQCNTDHDDMRNRQEPDWPLVQIGQNLGLGHKSFAAMIERFYTEQFRYNYTYGGGYKDGAGHYFQLVSHQTALIGCAESRCPSSRFKKFRICNYAPALNAIKRPYRNGTWCEDCPNNCDPSGKLCDCGGKLCYNAGTLDPATCQCICQRGKTGEHCEFVDCSVGDLLNSCNFGVYTKDDCGKQGTNIRDPTLCPHLCGLCDHTICGGKKCDKNLTLNKETCTCECVEPRCAPCGNMKCKNRHSLNSDTCTCDCLQGFTGRLCEICPASDHLACPQTTELCYSLAWHCPYLCGLCPSSDEEQTTRVTTVTTKRVTDKGVTSGGVTDKGVTNKGVTDKGVTDKGVTDKGVTDKGVTDKGITNKGVTDKGVTDKGVTDKGVKDRDGQGEGGREGGTAAHVHARNHTCMILVALLAVLSRVTAQHFC